MNSKSSLLRIAAAALLLVPLTAQISSAALADYRPGELLVKFKEGMASRARVSVIQRHGGVSLRTLDRHGLHQLRLAESDARSVEDAIAEFAQDPAVEYAQPNFIYRATALPNDPIFAQQWGLRNTGQTVTNGNYGTNPGASGDDMGLVSAWDTITDCSSTIVAVIDTGVNYNHEDLAANMWNGGLSYPHHGADFVSGSTTPLDPMDQNGHGTHVAGTIGAVGNNGLGGTGVCWKVQLMALRVLDATGSGSTSDIVSAVNFAVAHGAKVMNMSLGSSGASSLDTSFQAALKSASSAGVVSVVAAGNSGLDNDVNSFYPCNYAVPSLICVAALDQSYHLASFSDYGATTVHVGAPGTNILSSWYQNETVVTDAFLAGWVGSGTGSADWQHGTRNLTSDGVHFQTYDMMLDPYTWSPNSGNYPANHDARVHKSFNLSGATKLSLNVGAFYDIGAGDQLKVGVDTAGGDPFAGAVTSTSLANITGTTSGSSASLGFDISACNSSTCSIGFALGSGATPGHGVALFDFSIVSDSAGNQGYKIENGTSMATPHVAGLAAMLFAHQPAYTAADVVANIEQSGVSIAALNGATITGKAVNAANAVNYILPPAGFTAVNQ